MAMLKKKWKIILILCISVGFIVGLIGPFVPYKKVSSVTQEKVKKEKFKSKGNGPDRAMLLETNQSALDERIRLFDRAKKRIIISTFDLRNGKSTRDIFSILLKKAQEGVKVQIIVDGISSFLHMKKDPLFVAVAAQPGIEIKLYNKVNILEFYKLNGRMHDKYAIVDDIAYILGGRNMFDYFIGDYKTKNRSHDREILIYNTLEKDRKDSSLFQIKEYFQKIWDSDLCTLYCDEEGRLDEKEVKGEVKALEERYKRIRENKSELFEAYDYEKNTVPTGKVTLISNPTTVYGKEPVVFYTLTQLMEQAKERVLIHTPYIVANSYMYKRLEEICNKVPQVEMMINSVENGDNFVASSDYRYHKKRVLNTGVHLYEYDGGLSYHGKSLIIDDDISIIGSYNMDLRSTYVDTELMLVVNSEEFTEELNRAMEEMKKDCREVTGVKEYEAPEHLKIKKVSLWKKIEWTVFGMVIQPFRRLI